MQQPFARITTVLVRPIYPRNAGMCSRAICNVGAGRLILIAPHFDPQSLEAREGAAGGQRVLQEVTVYESLEKFYESEGEGTRIALTARDNRLRATEILTDKLESLLEAEKALAADTPRPLFDGSSPIYLLFGPEDDGLTYDDMKLAHHLCSLPVTGEVKSLNLSHAVLLTLHLVSQFLQRLDKPDEASTALPTPPLTKAYYPEKMIEDWLKALGFSLDRQRVNIALSLHRLLLDHQPRADDLKMLETILRQNIRKLKLSSEKNVGSD